MSPRCEMLLFSRKCVNAASANILSVQLNKLFAAAAEVAYGGVFHQNDTVAFCENLDGVCAGDAELFTDFLGNDYSAELVNVSYNTCGFHL